MTTHEDQRLGQKITKPMRGLMILGKGGMPQYATQGSYQLDQKVNETYGRSDDPREGGYAPVCHDGQTEMQNASKLLYSEICSSIM